MTKKLYYENSYMFEAECDVKEIIEREGKIFVVLESTPFYPEGGGQPSDRGTIDDIRVDYVFEEEDIIYHQMERRPERSKVLCKVDKERRIDYTVQHSGEHITAAAFFKLYGGVNCGFHMGEEYITLDIDIKDLTEDMVKRVEEEANYSIFRNEPVITYVTSKGEALKLPLRKDIKAEGDIRVVQIGDIDYSTCCGTHVQRSGEVGIIKIIKTEKYKGMTRVYIKCGKRALEDYSKKQDIVAALTKILSSEESEVVKKIEGQEELIKELNRKINENRKLLALQNSKELLAEASGCCIPHIYEDKSFEDIQYIIEAAEKHPFIFILGSRQDKKMIMLHNGSFDVKCGKLFKEHLSSLGGRGGGNDKRAQAAFAAAEDMEAFINKLASVVSGTC